MSRNRCIEPQKYNKTRNQHPKTAKEQKNRKKMLKKFGGSKKSRTFAPLFPLKALEA